MTSCCSVSALNLTRLVLYVGAAASIYEKATSAILYTTINTVHYRMYVEGVFQGARSAAVAVLRKRLAVHTLIASSVPPGLQ